MEILLDSNQFGIILDAKKRKFYWKYFWIPINLELFWMLRRTSFIGNTFGCQSIWNILDVKKRKFYWKYFGMPINLGLFWMLRRESYSYSVYEFLQGNGFGS